MRTRIGSVVAPARLVACVLLPAWLAGCGALNPAFVDVLDPTGSSASIAVAPGHVVIAFSNNATIDERIISYLESDDGGNLILTNAEKRSLRPLIRFRVLVTYTDGSRQIIEFLSGSRIVEPFYAGIAARDLDVPDLTNVVALCDVARVEFLPGAPIEVYVPTIIARFRFVAPTDQQESFFRREHRVPQSARGARWSTMRFRRYDRRRGLADRALPCGDHLPELRHRGRGDGSPDRRALQVHRWESLRQGA
jgi:hypothetical protein